MPAKRSTESENQVQETPAVAPESELVQKEKKEKKQRTPRTKKAAAANADAEAPAQENAGTTEPVKGGNASKRSFSVLKVTRDGNEEDFKGGKFLSMTPAGGARKAASQACKTLYSNEDNCTIDITMKEVTRNHPSKEYSYRATRTLNNKDVGFKGNAGEVKIFFRYSIALKSLKKDAKGNVVEEKEVVNDQSTV